MTDEHKYDSQIHAVAVEATCFMSSLLSLLERLLHDPSLTKRGASICIMKEIAGGRLPPVFRETRSDIARQFQARLEIETDPFLCDLLDREVAQLLDPDSESPFVHLEPSEN